MHSLNDMYVLESRSAIPVLCLLRLRRDVHETPSDEVAGVPERCHLRNFESDRVGEVGAVPQYFLVCGDHHVYVHFHHLRAAAVVGYPFESYIKI
jgi:hypothetical protein